MSQVKLSINRYDCHIYFWVTYTHYKFAKYKSAINVMYRNDTVPISFITFIFPKFDITLIIIIFNFTIKSHLIVGCQKIPFDKSQMVCCCTSWKFNCVIKEELYLTRKYISYIVVLYKLGQNMRIYHISRSDCCFKDFSSNTNTSILIYIWQNNNKIF